MSSTAKKSLQGEHGIKQTVPDLQIPQELIMAAKNIRDARILVKKFYDANPDLQGRTHGRIFKADELLVESAYELSDILGMCFLNTYFFFEPKETTL
jgi:hypothetical protein